MKNKILKGLAMTAIIASVATAQEVWDGRGSDFAWYNNNKEKAKLFIGNAKELAGLAIIMNNDISDFSGKTITLTNDIDLGNENWKPIGDNLSEKRRFRGIFDGNGKTISGLSVSGDEYAGLFGYVGESGQIKNLTVNVSAIIGTKYAGGLAGYYESKEAIEKCGVNIKDSIFSSSYSGGLAGSGKYNITIDNSYTTGNVSSSYYSGGLLGRGEGNITITNSYTTGSVSNSYSSGGLVGNGERITISNSYTTGDVSGSESSGGLIGEGRATISNSYTIGNVSSSGRSGIGNYSYSGGLVGYGYAKSSHITSSDIIDSYSTGNVFSSGGRSYSGGLVGNSNATIVNSYSAGNISSSGISSHSGGLVGGGSATINNSHTTGNVSAASTSSLVDSHSGGLVGGGSATITNSYTTGNISSSGKGYSYSGGLIGKGSATITNSYSTGDVFSSDKKSYSGGLAGSGGKYTIKYCYASGNITGNSAGGIFGYGEGANTFVYYSSEGAQKASGNGSPTNIQGISLDELRKKPFSFGILTIFGELTKIKTMDIRI